MFGFQFKINCGSAATLQSRMRNDNTVRRRTDMQRWRQPTAPNRKITNWFGIRKLFFLFHFLLLWSGWWLALKWHWNLIMEFLFNSLECFYICECSIWRYSSALKSTRPCPRRMFDIFFHFCYCFLCVHTTSDAPAIVRTKSVTWLTECRRVDKISRQSSWLLSQLITFQSAGKLMNV